MAAATEEHFLRGSVIPSLLSEFARDYVGCDGSARAVYDSLGLGAVASSEMRPSYPFRNSEDRPPLSDFVQDYAVTVRLDDARLAVFKWTMREHTYDNYIRFQVRAADGEEAITLKPKEHVRAFLSALQRIDQARADQYRRVYPRQAQYAPSNARLLIDEAIENLDSLFALAAPRRSR